MKFNYNEGYIIVLKSFFQTGVAICTNEDY